MASVEQPSNLPIQLQRAEGSFLSALIFRNVPEHMGLGGLMSLLVGLRNQLASKGVQQSGLFYMTSIENVGRYTWVVGFSDKDAASRIVGILREWLFYKTYNVRAEVLVNIPVSEDMMQSAIMAPSQPPGIPVSYPAFLLIARTGFYATR